MTSATMTVAFIFTFCFTGASAKRSFVVTAHAGAGSKVRMSEPSSSLLLEDSVEDVIEDASIDTMTLKKPATASTSGVADPALKFYFRAFLDILIFLIVMDGVRRYRGMSQETAQPESQTHTALPHAPMTQKPGRTGKQVTKEAAAASTKLNEAIRVGDVAQCAAILADADAFLTRRILSEPDLWGCNALHLAAHSGSAEIVSMLFERGGCNARVNAVDVWDQTPLHFAARAGSVAVCRILIDHGALVDAADAQEYTALHVAAKLGHEATCEFLLDQGAGVSSTPDVNIPPLLSALLVKRICDQHPATPADN